MALLFCAEPLFMPVVVQAETDQNVSGNPVSAIGQQLMREGDFAVKLFAVLELGVTADEAIAESRLAEAGISPHNGWMADYPVTPDIVGELANSVRIAAENNKIPLKPDQALERLNSLTTRSGIPVKADPAPIGLNATNPPQDYSINYSPSDEDIGSYYDNTGPPVITYYSPPVDYYYMYSWVPYPFWCFGFWYPGYFILNDFHRPVFAGGRRVFVTNHFRDGQGNWRGRVDVVDRFHRGSWAGRNNQTRDGTIPSAVSGQPRSSGSAIIPRANSGRAIGRPDNHSTLSITGNREITSQVPRTTGTISPAPPSQGRSFSRPAQLYRDGAASTSAVAHTGFNSAPATRSSGFSGERYHGSVSGSTSFHPSGGSSGEMSIRTSGFSGRGRR